jgi:PucR C-terminal helix-turn-helix domain/GGDEF-like domain
MVLAQSSPPEGGALGGLRLGGLTVRITEPGGSGGGSPPGPPVGPGRGRPPVESPAGRSAVSVADCLWLEALRDSEVIAGRQGLEAPVRRVSTGAQTHGCVPGELRLLGRLLSAEAVREAHDAGAAALAAAVVSLQAAQEAETLGLPVIRLSPGVDVTAAATELSDFIVTTLEVSLAGLGRVTARLAAAGAADLRLESMSAALAEAIRAPVLVEDAHLRVLCTAGGGGIDRNLVLSLRHRGQDGERAATALRDVHRKLAEGGGPAWLLPGAGEETVPRLVAPIVAAGELLGYCSAFFPDGIRDDGVHDGRVVAVALEQGAHLLGLALLHERVVGTSRRAACATMLVDLVDGRMSPQLLRTRAAQLGIELGGTIAVALFQGRSEQRPDDWLRHAITTLTGQRNTLVDVIDGVVVAALAGDERGRATRWLRGLCVTSRGGVGVLGRGTEAPGVPAAYSETRRVLDLLARSAAASEGAVVDVDDLGLLGVLIDSSATGALERFWQRRLAPLLEYDAREHSDLCGSLRAFFEEGGLRRAARRMNLHPNSLNYRLRRAEQIGGFSLADPDARLELQLALRCQRLLAP